MGGYLLTMKTFIFEVDKAAFTNFHPGDLPDYIAVKSNSFFKAYVTIEMFFDERLELEDWGVFPRYSLVPEDLEHFRVIWL